MHPYILDTEFAVSHPTADLVADRAELAGMEAAQTAALAKEAYLDLAFLQREMHPSANYWYGQLMEGQGNRTVLNRESLKCKLGYSTRFSISALASALLQPVPRKRPWR